MVPAAAAREVCAGAFHFSTYLSLPEQVRLLRTCHELGSRPAGFYVPTVRGGAKMRLEMVCFGHHWNALTYRYENTRADFDGLPVQPLPDDFAALAKHLAAAAGMEIKPDICIMNRYSAYGRLGLHQDKDERPETLAAGIPVVTISLGDTARFLLGGTRRKDPICRLLLSSGDAFVMGGVSRLRYHGVAAVVPGTAPKELALEGRYSLTFRQY